MKKKLKILLGYTYFQSDAYGDIEKIALDYYDRLRKFNFDVEGFCLTLNPPGPCLTFAELDKKWKMGDKQLLKMYARLEEALEGKDVFINESGVNLHPEFVSKLPVFTVFQCFDDPENSENLSKPCAASYDLSFVGNIAEVETYRSWGVKNAEWVPMGVFPEIYDSSITYKNILNERRDIDFFMMIDKESKWRKERLEKIESAFPGAHFYGKGWSRGFLPDDKKLEYLRRSKIGPNIHNSTGPINYRTFYLPANGVMQVCDNKSYLSKIFELGKEAIGFDTIEECIELCKYYLKHDDERRKIAAAGWKKVMDKYTEKPIFERKTRLILDYMRNKESRSTEINIAIRYFRKHRLKNVLKLIGLSHLIKL